MNLACEKLYVHMYYIIYIIIYILLNYGLLNRMFNILTRGWCEVYIQRFLIFSDLCWVNLDAVYFVCHIDIMNWWVHNSLTD